ncbi:uncharacterized protein LOC133389313 isoform X2 [Rhineura floridana]|uniref:uncharacterized protein LOC133389313 isoform X2 n=1 Tax=Rhineura floridana TaxID=261503 RepID=UPI002AC80538|nr:uncharacterized protein LOC133389313 isoform X2 [Rhineura floridana]
MVLAFLVCAEGFVSGFGGGLKQEFSLPETLCFPEMPAGRSFKKAKREENTGDAKHCRKKDGCLFKKRFSTLSFFSGHSQNVTSQERNMDFEDKKRGLQRQESKQLKAPTEEVCSLGKAHSGKMCPKCEIIVCRVCNMLHTESSFIAHSLLDHYDAGRHSSCCLDSGFPQDHHVCKHSPGPPLSHVRSCNLTTLETKSVLRFSLS